MEALNCTYDDYQKAVGFSGLGTMARILPWSREFFKIENGGMRLPGVHRSILASRPLDQFVTQEFEKYSAPDTRLFGENTFTITGTLDNFRVGHVERYCGPTLRMKVSTMRLKSGGPIAALAHTHPLFKGANASLQNHDGERFGPADWIPLVAFGCPVYLYTPRRKIYVMEYNGNFVIVRGKTGGAKKWRVSQQ